MNVTDTKSWPLVPHVSKSFRIEQSQLHAREDLKARMQMAMEDSFKAQFRDYHHFHQYGMGDVVVLVGTSTAGKTSIIKALQQLESTRVEDGVDLRCNLTFLNLMNKFHPHEIEILSRLMKNRLDIAKVIGSKERSWKTDITSLEEREGEEAIQRIKETADAFFSKGKEEIDRVFQNIELEMFDDAFEHSRRGGNIIFDVLMIDALSKHLLTRQFNGPIRIALTYCPFYLLSSRMEKRNKEAVESGEFSNQRIGEFPLMQFSEIYTRKEKRQVAFERLSREQVTQAFDENFDKGVEADRKRKHQLPPEKQIALDKKRLRAEFLTNLGFKEGVDVVEVAPRNQQLYDLFINSSQFSPSQSAKLIHNGTHLRY